MPFYRYKHSCGYEGDQFLTQDKESVVLNCARCGLGTTAHQVRDKSIKVHEKDEVRGVFRNEHGGSNVVHN
jgi:hypothetical protein